MSFLPGRRPLLLELDLTRPPADGGEDGLLGRLTGRGGHTLRPTLRALHEAGDDRRVGGLIVKVGGTLPWAVMQELRTAVRAFAATGKPTLAWAESFGEGPGSTAAYVLASAFDEVWLQPGGGLGPFGVAVQTTFVRGALDKLGVEPELEQRREYKNAVDQVLRTGYTQAHREASDRLAASLWDDAVAMIAAGRGIAPSRVRELADTGPWIAAEARDAGLVDRLGYRDEAYAAIGAAVERPTELLFADHWRPRNPLWRRLRPQRRHVALVEVRGGIVSGRSRRSPMGRQVGSDTVGAALRAAAASKHVAAVVLQVDSPGGSAVASETIWREVVRVRDEGKPVVVSMGSAAASGGYYVSCPADVIVALPATMTGSIGVFGGKFVVRDLLERLGLTTDSVVHGARATMFSARRRFTDDERARFAATTDAIYDDFVAKVAHGRGRTTAEIDEIARGRVWTGRDALSVGLVDELGGLRDAVRIARERAGLPADAPVRRAGRPGPLARLGRPRNSEDPRAAGASLPTLSSALRMPAGAQLVMPPVTVR